MPKQLAGAFVLVRREISKCAVNTVTNVTRQARGDTFVFVGSLRPGYTITTVTTITTAASIRGSCFSFVVAGPDISSQASRPSQGRLRLVVLASQSWFQFGIHRHHHHNRHRIKTTLELPPAWPQHVRRITKTGCEMKNTMRNRKRRTVRPPSAKAGLRDKLETKLLKVCAEIGWICGWREERPKRRQTTRRSSWKQVMLGRAPAADAKAQEGEVFRPVEVAFVSGGRTAYDQAEPATEASVFVANAIDLRDELARLRHMGIGASQVVDALGSVRVRSLGRQL